MYSEQYFADTGVPGMTDAAVNAGVPLRVDSGIPDEQQLSFYRDWVYRAIREVGRSVTLDLRSWSGLFAPGHYGFQGMSAGRSSEQHSYTDQYSFR